ncbi:MAG TPA: hypothetical protein VIK50_04910 [Gemmatimonadaceae bacterium]
MRTPCVLLAVVLIPSIAIGQSAQPEGWRVKADGGAPDSAVSHRGMPPGWHITTGPAAILYNPANQTRGRFAVEAEIFLFPGDSDEGYGVFLGGSHLDEGAASWTAFLITRDGSASIEKRQNNAVHSVYPPTKSAAVKPHTGEGTAHNILRVLVQGDSVIFSANGERIAALFSRDLPLEGTFGFRIGKDVNLHVSNLDLVTRLAPFPVRR